MFEMVYWLCVRACVRARKMSTCNAPINKIQYKYALSFSIMLSV